MIGAEDLDMIQEGSGVSKGKGVQNVADDTLLFYMSLSQQGNLASDVEMFTSCEGPYLDGECAIKCAGRSCLPCQ